MATLESDFASSDWVGRCLPRKVQPYARLARLDRPIGTWLLLFPCWWSLILSSRSLAALLGWGALFTVGAVVMRGAGCTINDILDARLDAEVARTRNRPLPSGEVSRAQALIFLILELAIGAVVLSQLNRFAIGLGVASLVLVFTYPLAKRVTWFPQFVLGLAFNWGALLGWAAVTGALDLAPVLLYAGGIAWTLAYDTIYAHMDKDDDARIGIKSTARLFGRASKPIIAGLFAVAWMGFAAAGMAAGLPVGALELLLVPVAVQFLWQVWTWRSDDPKDSLIKFRSNRWAGWLVLAAFGGARALGLLCMSCA